MDPVAEQVAFTKAVLLKCVVSNDHRLKNGSKLRTQMQEDYKKGLRHVENNYRYLLLKDSVAKVTELLGNISVNFNVCHSEDMMSTQDCLDILLATASKFQSS